MKTISKRERGSLLVVVIIVLFCLTLLGYATMQLVGTDNEVAGKYRRSQNALYLAQAGVAWGMDLLRGPPYNVTDETENFSDVLAALSDALVTDDASPLRGYFLLPGSPVTFGDGSYSVGVRDDLEPDGDPTSDTNSRIHLLAVGVGADQSRRAIEVTLMVGD